MYATVALEDLVLPVDSVAPLLSFWDFLARLVAGAAELLEVALLLPLRDGNEILGLLLAADDDDDDLFVVVVVDAEAVVLVVVVGESS